MTLTPNDITKNNVLTGDEHYDYVQNEKTNYENGIRERLASKVADELEPIVEQLTKFEKKIKISMKAKSDLIVLQQTLRGSSQEGKR